MRARTVALLDRLSLRIDPDTPAEYLSAAHRQLLQVARALAFECEILVLDEPTTALTDSEADHLFDVLRELQRGGTTLVYVSHRLPEVFRLCDRISVLRDGELVGTYDRSRRRARRHRSGNGWQGSRRSRVALRLARRRGQGLSIKQSLPSTTLPRRLAKCRARRDCRPLRPGRIGPLGAAGNDVRPAPPASGRVEIDGATVSFGSARDAVRAGLALVPEERQRQGLFFNLTLRDNLVLASCAVKRDLLVRERDEVGVAAGLLGTWRIKAAGVDAMPDNLSGGNQQKVVLAKWLAANPRVLLLDEPTKGVDVGAKFEIHEMIRRQAASPVWPVLVVSSDLPEILALSDRVLVMKEGTLQGELPGDAATEEAVMHLATHDPFDSQSRRDGLNRSLKAGRSEAVQGHARAQHGGDPHR